MSFSRPSLQDLINQAQADIEGRLPGADAKLRRSNLNVIGRVVAGVAHGLYGFLAWIARQILPDTCDEEMLLRYAAIWLPDGRVAASYATGNVTITGTIGSVIEAGTVLQRGDGVEYQTDAELTLAGASATLAVTAVAAGQAGNAVAGTALTLVTPVVGVSSSAVVAAGDLTGGADVESVEALRQRVIDRIRQPPHGGSAADYVAWAKEVAGVTRAWCYPQELGDGTVTVRFVRDDDASQIPDPAEVAAVQAYIDARRPVTGVLTVVAPVAVPIDFQIDLTPDSASVRAAVEAELRDLLLRESEPGATILVTHIREAVSLAAGETDHVLAAPAADVTHTVGQMATFGSVTWL